MPDLLSTGLSALTAFQRVLDVTGNNIANANTPGYSRQVATLSTRLSEGGGSLYIGNGVQVAGIRRSYDEFLGGQLQTATTGQARFDTLNTLASRLDVLLADPSTGLNVALQDFFGAVQDVANDPASIPARQALLGDAGSLVQRFASIDQRLDETEAELNQRISQSVADINRLAGSIVEVNDRIARSQGGEGRAPNDLLDERDGLIRELSSLINVSTTLQDDGTMSVFIGSGQSLVVGNAVAELSADGSEFDPTRLEVNFRGNNGSTPLDSVLTGGTLGGLLEFRGRMLDPARQAVGQTAVAVAQRFNEQHSAGLDLRGALGTDFFSVAAPSALPSSGNAGSATATVAVSDIAAFSGDDFVLEFDGANYALTRFSTNEPVAMSGSGTPADPFVAEGISIAVAGSPATGDRMLIRSAGGAAGSLAVRTDDPQAIALALPTRAEASLNNLGDATISPASVVDAEDPALLTPAVIEFLTPTTYSIDGAGSFAYVADQPIVINGSQVSISGSPLAGDRFTIDANTGASGDNGNGLLLADVQSVGLLDGGTISINQSYGRLVADVGSATRQIQANLDAQNVVYDNVQNEYSSRSGVNLDEEAANLIRFQQAYQAAAQIVAVTSTLFDTLISTTRR